MTEWSALSPYNRWRGDTCKSRSEQPDLLLCFRTCHYPLTTSLLPGVSVQRLFYSSGISTQPHAARRSFMGHFQGVWNTPSRMPALVPSSTGIITPDQQPAVRLLWYRLRLFVMKRPQP